MTLPPSLHDRLGEVLGGPVTRARPASGGDINLAAIVEAGGETVFVKWNAHAPPAMFPTEARGLRLLARANAIRVPQVIAQGDADGACPAFLVLEYVVSGGRSRSADTMERFGEALAELHGHTAATYGLDEDNFIGRLPQPNTPSPRWIDFYREHRLGFQMELARQRGRLPARRERRLTRLMERLPEWIDEEAVTPSLIHGDLWGGNYLIDERSHAVLIDPAVCYADREMDLAMSELFGGFSARFYDAYFAVYPAPGYPERRALYQLYYMLVHLNLFGESYGGRVDSIAAHYVG